MPFELHSGQLFHQRVVAASATYARTFHALSLHLCLLQMILQMLFEQLYPYQPCLLPSTALLTCSVELLYEPSLPDVSSLPFPARVVALLAYSDELFLPFGGECPSHSDYAVFRCQDYPVLLYGHGHTLHPSDAVQSQSPFLVVNQRNRHLSLDEHLHIHPDDELKPSRVPVVHLQVGTDEPDPYVILRSEHHSILLLQEVRSSGVEVQAQHEPCLYDWQLASGTLPKLGHDRTSCLGCLFLMRRVHLH